MHGKLCEYTDRRISLHNQRMQGRQGATSQPTPKRHFLFLSYGFTNCTLRMITVRWPKHDSSNATESVDDAKNAPCSKLCRRLDHRGLLFHGSRKDAPKRS